MAQTHIPAGDPLARKVFGAACFAELTVGDSFSGRITGPAPTQAEAESKLSRNQTKPTYPCVRVTDLSKGMGDTVSVDLFNILQGKPTTGDRKISGNMMKLDRDSMDIKINQMRGGVDPGGRMTQQRTVYKLRTIGRANLVGWWRRFMDQWKQVHLAGARGSHDTPDWVVPLASDPDFSDIMVNSVTAPTYNRHYYAGDATALDELDTTDIMTLDDIDRLRSAIFEGNMTLQPIVLEDDPAAWDEPLYCLYVTPRQWHFLQNRTGEKAWRNFLAQARERGSKNPLFSGNPGMWSGILVKRMERPIRFNQGDTVTVATSADEFTTTTVQIGATQFSATNPERHNVDRAILLGSQALAEVWGKDSETGTHMRWWEELTDHGNTWEGSVAGIGGCSKLRFKDSDGVTTDHGVYVLDSYAPDPRYIKVA